MLNFGKEENLDFMIEYYIKKLHKEIKNKNGKLQDCSHENLYLFLF